TVSRLRSALPIRGASRSPRGASGRSKSRNEESPQSDFAWRNSNNVFIMPLLLVEYCCANACYAVIGCPTNFSLSMETARHRQAPVKWALLMLIHPVDKLKFVGQSC